MTLSRIALLIVACLGLATLVRPQEECAPLTLTTLSRLSGAAVPFAHWKATLMPDGVTPPEIDAVTDTWSVEEPYLDLIPAGLSTLIKPTPPGLYLVVYSPPMVEVVWRRGSEADSHLCLAWLGDPTDDVILVHTLYSDDDRQLYEIQRVTRAAFDTHALVAFEVVPASPLILHLRRLDSL